MPKVAKEPATDQVPVKFTREERKAKLQEFCRYWEQMIKEAKEAGNVNSMEKRFAHQFEGQLLEGVLQLKQGIDFRLEEKIKRDWADVLIPKKMVIEMKSPGKNLEDAYKQAKERYWEQLPYGSRPRFVMVSDFERFWIYDMKSIGIVQEDLFGKQYLEGPVERFKLSDFPNKIHTVEAFADFIPKEQFLHTDLFDEALPLNRRAAEKVGKLHLMLSDLYKGNHQSDLEILLVRLVFCLFAEDEEGLFKPHSFTDFLNQQTTYENVDEELAKLFTFLDTKPNEREQLIKRRPFLKDFPYVNGGLFKKTILIKPFTKKMHDCLLECTDFDWSGITPDLFGSIFQSAVDDIKRHELGEHYTSPKNIAKSLKPLFLDQLNEEFNKILDDRSDNRLVKLSKFQNRLASIKVFDPACGCGNFLVVAYQQLRQLELKVLEALREIYASGHFMIKDHTKVSIKQFFGLEIEPFPCEVSRLSIWLMQLICDKEAKDRFCQTFTSIPLQSNPNIITGNAATTDWEKCFPVEENDEAYIVGNPPFSGNYKTTERQRKEVNTVFNHIPGSGKLDYVSLWFKKAFDFMNKHPKVETSFVSTNSIFQGEQVYPLWSSLFGAGGGAYKILLPMLQVGEWSKRQSGRPLRYFGADVEEGGKIGLLQMG